jgi:hypothetical protein
MHGAAIFELDFPLFDVGFLYFELGKSRLGRADDDACRRERGNRSRKRQALRKAQPIQSVPQEQAPEFSLAKSPILLCNQSSKTPKAILGKKNAVVCQKSIGLPNCHSDSREKNLTPRRKIRDVGRKPAPSINGIAL